MSLLHTIKFMEVGAVGLAPVESSLQRLQPFLPTSCLSGLEEALAHLANSSHAYLHTLRYVGISPTRSPLSSVSFEQDTSVRLGSGTGGTRRNQIVEHITLLLGEYYMVLLLGHDCDLSSIFAHHNSSTLSCKSCLTHH